jgi:hypothetical protein
VSPRARPPRRACPRRRLPLTRERRRFCACPVTISRGCRGWQRWQGRQPNRAGQRSVA